MNMLVDIDAYIMYYYVYTEVYRVGRTSDHDGSRYRLMGGFRDTKSTNTDTFLRLGYTI